MRFLSMAIAFLFSLSDGRLHSYFYSSLLVHALHPSLTVRIEPSQQVFLDADLVLAWTERHLALLLQDGAHRVTAEMETMSDLPQAHAILMEQIHRLALVRCDHVVVSRCRKRRAGPSGSRPSADESGRKRRATLAGGPDFCPSPAACTSALAPGRAAGFVPAHYNPGHLAEPAASRSGPRARACSESSPASTVGRENSRAPAARSLACSCFARSPPVRTAQPPACRSGSAA